MEVHGHEDDYTNWEHLSESDEENQNNHLVTQIFTANELMIIGLKLVKYTTQRIKQAKRKTNVERFVGHYGSTPEVCAAIFEDLQKANVLEARIPASKINVNDFLMALHHLKRYPTELEREPIFDVSRKWGRDLCWYYIEKIRALKHEKIVWPEDNFGNDIWVLTVDGIHFWIQEPQHPEWSQDSKYFSHKYGKAGLDYELGISLTTQQLVWMNGPFPAGSNDVSIFTSKGLKDKLIQAGKKAIGDGGYHGHHKAISTPNSFDMKIVKKLKGRALKRHETFNNLLKNFKCLDGRFRHSQKRFADCCEAVCVICQYQIENNRSLFDVLIDDLANNQ